MKMHGQQIQGALLVYDSNNITTTTGFDVLFDNGANVIGLWRFFTEHNGLPGSHLFLGSFATGEFTSLDATDWTFFPPVGVVPGEHIDNDCLAFAPRVHNVQRGGHADIKGHCLYDACLAGRNLYVPGKHLPVFRTPGKQQ